MTSLLVSELKRQVASALAGQLLTGTIRRDVAASLDPETGAPVVGSVDTFAVGSLIRETFDAAWAAQAGVPQTDVAILVVLGSTTTAPQQGDLVHIGAPVDRWHRVRRVLDIDPAGATARLQAYEVPAP